MRPLTSSLLVAAIVVSHAVAYGQTLPLPSRSVYKCEVNGKIQYSDTPCVGARRVDVTPTRGLDKATGQARTGEDVRREKHNESMADALKPLLNETPEARALRHRRYKLGADARRECQTLDYRISELEAQEKVATRDQLTAAQRDLYAARARYHDVRC